MKSIAAGDRTALAVVTSVREPRGQRSMTGRWGASDAFTLFRARRPSDWRVGLGRPMYLMETRNVMGGPKVRIRPAILGQRRNTEVTRGHSDAPRRRR
jgi:hypothetical protein